MREHGFAVIERAWEWDAWRLLVWNEVTWSRIEEPPKPDHVVLLSADAAETLMRTGIAANIPEGQPMALVNENVRYLRGLIDRILPAALRGDTDGET